MTNTMINVDVGVILPAAGHGERMGASLPKQYINILEKPLFLYPLEAFLSFSFVKRIVLITDNLDKVNCILERHRLADCGKISLVIGDKTRHRSIKAGILDLYKFHKESELKIVVVHDGVRPFVPKSLVEELILAAITVGAAGPTRPLVATVVRPDENSTLDLSLNRNAYSSSETPQAFQFNVLYSAYTKATDEELDYGTECLQLVLNHCNVKAKLIASEVDLCKVTYNRDVHIVEALIKEKTTDVCIISEKETETLQVLIDGLSGKVATLKSILGGPSYKAKDNGKTYNAVILLHVHEIHQDLHLLDFANLIDLEKKGLIIHIIDHASLDGLQSMSVYNLHRNSRKMAHHYEKLHKGVVVIHCVSSNEIDRLATVVSTLIQSDSYTFSGQTLFI